MSDAVYSALWHVLYVVITIPIIFGNLLILISIIRFKRLRCTMHILIGNLAMADLIIGVILIPFDFAATIFDLNKYKYVCLGKLSMFVLSIGSSCLSLLFISIERFAAIVFPLHAPELFTKYKIALMISVGWILPFFNSTLPMYGLNEYNENNTDCTSDTLYTYEYKIMLNWQLILALVINFVLYAIVMKVALKKAKASKIGEDMIIHTKTQRDLQQLTTMVIVLGMFAVCWLPYVGISVVVTFYENSYTQYIRRCTLIPGLLNSAVNWVIYGYRNKNFRKAFRVILRLKSTTESSSEYNDTTVSTIRRNS